MSIDPKNTAEFRFHNNSSHNSAHKQNSNSSQNSPIKDRSFKIEVQKDSKSNKNTEN